MSKQDQEFSEFRKDFRRYMAALLERLDTLNATLAEIQDEPAPPPAPQEPLPGVS
jgi:hypothetical protein